LKKALSIVLLVAAYSLCETLILLFTIARIDLYPFPSLYQWIVSLGQLLLIPGSAALFSRLLYGSYRWGIRAVTIVVVSAATFVLMMAIAYGIYKISNVTWVFPFTIAALVIVILLLLACGIGAVLFLFFRSVARRTARIESRRWLAARQTGLAPEVIRWRNRGLRWALCIPSALVLLVLLFLPEAWGIVSHFGHPWARVLGGYRIPIPTTWIVLDQGEVDWEGYVSARGLAGRGMGFDFAPYVADDLPLSTWTVRIAPTSRSPESARSPWTPQDSEVVGRRVFTIGNENVTCLEYWPSYLERPVRIESSERAFVSCSGSQRLSASLFGERIHLATFYRMLEGVQAP